MGTSALHPKSEPPAVEVYDAVTAGEFVAPSTLGTLMRQPPPPLTALEEVERFVVVTTFRERRQESRVLLIEGSEVVRDVACRANWKPGGGWVEPPAQTIIRSFGEPKPKVVDVSAIPGLDEWLAENPNQLRSSQLPVDFR